MSWRSMLIFLLGYSEDAPQKDYSLESSKSARTFSAFTSISIMASVLGNGILPEIQVRPVPEMFSMIA